MQEGTGSGMLAVEKNLQEMGKESRLHSLFSWKREDEIGSMFFQKKTYH